MIIMLGDNGFYYNLLEIVDTVILVSNQHSYFQTVSSNLLSVDNSFIVNLFVQTFTVLFESEHHMYHSAVTLELNGGLYHISVLISFPVFLCVYSLYVQTGVSLFCYFPTHI